MEGEENLYHHHQDEAYYFLQNSDEYLNAQDMAFLTPLAAKRKLFEIGGIQILGGEAEDACQTCQNQPNQEAMQAIHNDVRLARKVNSNTRCLSEKKGNILPNGTESEVCNLKGKATLGSMTPMTPIERKRLNDKNYRKRKREEKINLQEENKNLHEDVQRLSQENAQLKNVIEQLSSRNDQPKSSLVESKAKFELNFHDDESKKEAMNMVVDLPDMDDIHLKVKKRILKLKGSFDTEAVLHMLNSVCDTHLLSKVNVPSVPGPSTVTNWRVPAVKLR